MTAAGPDTVSIRPATPNDVAAIVRIERGSFTDPWSATAFATLIGRSETMFDVAVRDAGEGEQVVGFCVAYVVGDQSELANLAVDASARRDGIGGRLLQHVMRTAVARGARELFLEVRVSNDAARTLYETHGFETIGRRVKYYVKPDEDALVLRRTLP